MVTLRKGALRFRLVGAFGVIPVLPKHTTDDTMTTTTRGMEVAPPATARPVPRVECAGSGHVGAVVLIARARSFV